MGLFSGILSTLGNILVPGIGGAVGGLAGGLYDADQAEEGVRDQNNANAAEAAKTRDFNADQARISREFADSQGGIQRNFNSAEAAVSRGFTERMANTSYQRAMADMSAAGINPMLAVSQGGATTPGASSASAGLPSSSSASGVAARFENSKAAGLEQAIVGQRLSNETAVANSTAELNRASAAKVAAETVNVPTSGANIAASTDKIRVEIDQVRENIRKVFQDTSTSLSQSNLNEQHRLESMSRQILMSIDGQLKDSTISHQAAHVALMKVQTALESLNIEGAGNKEYFDSSRVGKVATFLGRLLSEISGVGPALKGMIK